MQVRQSHRDYIFCTHIYTLTINNIQAIKCMVCFCILNFFLFFYFKLIFF